VLRGMILILINDSSIVTMLASILLSDVKEAATIITKVIMLRPIPCNRQTPPGSSVSLLSSHRSY
jgi:hypothetical protein